MTELDIEIAHMSDTEAKNALRRLIKTLSETIKCCDDTEACPISDLCHKNSWPCDMVWLDFAKGEK